MRRHKLFVYLLFSFLGLSFSFFNLLRGGVFATQNSFNPIADSYVDSSQTSANFGSSTQIRVDGSPIVRSYLKFDVTGISGSVTAAKLRIYANSNHSLGFDTRSVADNSWSEGAITYSNAPAVSPAVTGSSGPITAGIWYEVDVTPLVSGNGLVSFGLSTASSTAMSLASRESVNKPQLIVDYASENSSPSPAPSPAVTPSPVSSPSSSPTPSPSPAQDPVIAAVGDMVCGAGSTGASCKQQEVSDLVISMNPANFLALGDVQYESGEYNDFVNYYDPSYGRFKNISKPSIGNHEYNDPAGSSDPTKVGYWDYFNGTGAYSGIAGDRDKGYYSFNVGNWHIIALNSNCSKVGGCSVGSAQNNWLRADLAANLKPCTLAYYHHPLFSSGGRATTSNKPLWEALYQYGGDVILTGHDHTYERFAPMDASGNLDTAYGIKEFVVGTGGRNHTHLATPAVNSEVFDDTSFGALKMTLHDNSYDWQFVPIPGNTFTDSGTASCHGAPGATPSPSPAPTPSPSPSPAPGNTLIFNPSDDATVKANSPSNNFGSATTVETDNNPLKKILLKFNVTGITGTVTSAKLKLRNTDSSNFGGSISKALSSTWTEGTVNWNNAPALDSTILASLGSVSAGNWYEIDVTGAIVGNETVSFGITSTSNNGADYSSREGGPGVAPQLILTILQP